MSKTVKRVLWGLGSVLGLVVVGVIVLVLLMMPAMRRMHPVETGEVCPGVYALKDANVNLYLVRGDSGLVAIDAGNSVQGVEKAFGALSLDPAQVKAVFLTHGDADHTGGLSLFPNAQVYLARAEEAVLNGETARFWIFKAEHDLPHLPLEDGQIVDLPGVSVRTILTPGHTPGALCYVVNDSLLFVGDTMGLKDGQATPFVRWFNKDTDQQKVSISRLVGLEGVRYVFTGHHGMSDRVDQVFEGWR